MCLILARSRRWNQKRIVFLSLFKKFSSHRNKRSAFSDIFLRTRLFISLIFHRKLKIQINILLFFISYLPFFFSFFYKWLIIILQGKYWSTDICQDNYDIKLRYTQLWLVSICPQRENSFSCSSSFISRVPSVCGWSWFSKTSCLYTV